jgi:hypothetical protein
MPAFVNAHDSVSPRASIRAASRAKSARERAAQSRHSAWNDAPVTFLAVKSSR